MNILPSKKKKKRKRKKKEAGTFRVDKAPQLLRKLSSLLPRVSAPLHALLTNIPKASCPRSDKVSNFGFPCRPFTLRERSRREGACGGLIELPQGLQRYPSKTPGLVGGFCYCVWEVLDVQLMLMLLLLRLGAALLLAVHWEVNSEAAGQK